MRPKAPSDDGQNDLFKARLDQIVDLEHPLAKLGQVIDWGFLEEKLDVVCTDGPGQPPLPKRLMAELAILKFMHDLSDEALCARWGENPYYQLFCGEAFFRHDMVFDRSSMMRWRQRMGGANQRFRQAELGGMVGVKEERLVALLQESLEVDIIGRTTGLRT